MGVMRLLVPVSMHRLIFNSVHSLAHPGIRATRCMLTSRFVWTSCSAGFNSVHVPRSSRRREQQWMLFRGPGGAMATDSGGPHPLADSGEQDNERG